MLSMSESPGTGSGTRDSDIGRNGLLVIVAATLGALVLGGVIDVGVGIALGALGGLVLMTISGVVVLSSVVEDESNPDARRGHDPEQSSGPGGATLLLIMVSLILLTGVFIDAWLLTILGAFLTLALVGAITVTWFLEDGQTDRA